MHVEGVELAAEPIQFGQVTRSRGRCLARRDQHYERTRISTAKGERWFCSEAQARAAGWRRAKR